MKILNNLCDLVEQRSHFCAEYTDGGISDSYRDRGYYGNVCYGEIANHLGEYECGLKKLSVFYNPKSLYSRKLTEFVLSQEMFGKAFLDTDIDKGMKEGFHLNVEVPYHFILGAIITLRATMTEDFVERFDLCNKFVEDKLKCLFLADRFMYSYNGIHKAIGCRYTSLDSCIFPYSFTLKNVKPPVMRESHSAEEGADNWDFWDVWGEGRRPSIPSDWHLNKDITDENIKILIKREEDL